MMRAIARFLLIAAFVANNAVAGEIDLPLKFDPARDAAKDVAAAVALAKSRGVRVLIDVGGEWCSWCHIMDRFFAANEDARTLREQHYVWLKVNWSKDNRNEVVLSRWPKIQGYPHLFVLDSDGALLHSQDTSLLEAGKGYSKARFIAFLTRWASGAILPGSPVIDRRSAQ